MMTEDRLRELLQDPRWALPAWPDARGRVRRAARRQRLTLAGVGAVVTAVITAAAVLPVMLLGRGGDARYALATPPLGVAGFTEEIYPAPVQARVTTGWLTLCPSPDGIQNLSQNASAQAVAILDQLGQPPATRASKRSGSGRQPAIKPSAGPAFTSLLRLSDRAFWPRLTSGGGLGVVNLAATAPVLWSGPLHDYQGSPELASAVAAGCGSRVLRDTWVVVSGRAAGPTRTEETFFLNRRGHMLVYNAT